MFMAKKIRNLILLSLLINFLVDLDVIIYIRLFILGEEFWDIVFSFLNIASLILFYVTGFIVNYLYLRPVDLYLNDGSWHKLKNMAKRRTLNFPVFSACYWSVLWAGSPPFLYFAFRLKGSPLLEIPMIHIVLIGLLGGTLSVAFIYFVLELAVRKWLIKPVFIGSPVADQPGVWRINLRLKMIFRFGYPSNHNYSNRGIYENPFSRAGRCCSQFIQVSVHDPASQRLGYFCRSDFRRLDRKRNN